MIAKAKLAVLREPDHWAAYDAKMIFLREGQGNYFQFESVRRGRECEDKRIGCISLLK